MIRLESVSKVYHGGHSGLRELSLDVADGEFMVLVGPSGSGKSTVLKLLAGLTRPTSGRVFIGDRDVTRLPPQERDVAMVFQSYALYPHMTVRANLEFGLRMRGAPRPERRARVEEAARMLGIVPLLERSPAALSGGERQRVAMGRAMVRQPKAFLMDEPLSNLDAKLRVQVRAEIVQLKERLRTTTVYVTHDQVEAMTLGERVAVLHEGQLHQVDSPRALYETPVNIFVASFIGSPGMNLFRSPWIERTSVKVGDVPLSLPPDALPTPTAPREVIVGIRPSAFESDGFADPSWPRLEVVARAVEDLGSEKVVIFDIEGASEEAFQARVHARTPVTPGARLRLAVDEQEVYLFDPDSQRCIAWPSASAAGARSSASHGPSSARTATR
jgi:multiple sugar transport system ATP-binding protein